MNPIQFNKPSFTLRLSSLLAAVVITAVLVGSQFGIAEGYTAMADVNLAAKRSNAIAQQAAAPAARRPRS